MSTTRRSIQLDDKLLKDISNIAAENNRSVNIEIAEALKFYRDYRYMNDKATFINSDIIKLIDSRLALMEQRVNAKTNQVLSSTAIELAIVEEIMAAQLDISPSDVAQFRINAVNFIKMNNRAFRLDELIE